MRGYCKEAAEFAVSEHKRGRWTAIVVPDRGYQQAMIDLGEPPKGIFIRYATEKGSLMSIRVDTLITIEAAKMAADSLVLAKCMVGLTPEQYAAAKKEAAQQ